MPTISRPPPARLPGRGHPRLRGDDRGREDGRRRSRSGSSSTPCGASSTGRRRAGSGSSIRSRWSSTNWPAGRVETMEVVNNPEDPSAGTRQVRVLGASCGSSATTSWRSRRRSSSGWRPGARSASGTRTSSPADEVVKDEAGRVVELRCTYDPATRGGDAPDGRRPRRRSTGCRRPTPCPAEVRLYDHLFRPTGPGRRRRPVRGPQPGVRDHRPRRDAGAGPGRTRRPARPSSSSGSATSRRTRTRARTRLVFNRTLTLKDTWAKVQGRAGA